MKKTKRAEMKKTVNINELGWNGNATATLNRCGCYEWTDSHDTMWEYDPETRESRHCGTDTGCIWTEWECV